MAGITDLPFRTVCKQFGPGLTYTEMVSSKALYYNDEKTKKLLKVNEQDGPIAVQIFGSDIQSMEFAANYVSDTADIIDINMGCPAPKVVKNGDGSRLLQNLELLEQIVKVVVKNSKSTGNRKNTKRLEFRKYCCCRSSKDNRSGGSFGYNYTW